MDAPLSILILEWFYWTRVIEEPAPTSGLAGLIRRWRRAAATRYRRKVEALLEQRGVAIPEDG